MTATVPCLPKDLLDLDDYSPDQLSLILDLAESFKEISRRTIKKVPTLRGKLVVLFFHENSTRTRLSFEVAAKWNNPPALAAGFFGATHD